MPCGRKSPTARDAELQAHVRLSESLADGMVQIDRQNQALNLMREQVRTQQEQHQQEADSLEQACMKLAEMQGEHSMCQAALQEAEQGLHAHRQEVEAQRRATSEVAVEVNEKQKGLEQQLWGAAKQEEELESRSVQVAQQREAFSSLRLNLK
eukprot:TRINITY_DN9235_c0_g1_i2.p1 TRINITY_DN9235_c0_g1~~TRINITY_DN9235_c0_g1_i2.p1  ORF type:complete len:153 (+),score=43.50 TRINITY_DN9235_c0_g1_i2:519-977(+)